VSEPLPGVVSGALFMTPQAYVAAPTDPQQLLNSLQSGAASTSEIQFVDPPTRAIVNGSLRTAASDADGVPLDHNPSQIRVVINPNNSDGHGEQEMSAAEFRRQIMHAQTGGGFVAPSAPGPAAYQMAPPPAAPQLSIDTIAAALAALGAVPPPMPAQMPMQMPQAVDASAQYARTHECGLDFLTTVPSKPQQRVTFNLGPGGVHRKRYHHAMFAGTLLSLCYDTRYDDEDFVPPATQLAGQDEAPITVTVDALEKQYVCLVHPELNTQLGCVRIVNLLVVGLQPIDA